MKISITITKEQRFDMHKCFKDLGLKKSLIRLWFMTDSIVLPFNPQIFLKMLNYLKANLKLYFFRVHIKLTQKLTPCSKPGLAI